MRIKSKTSFLLKLATHRCSIALPVIGALLAGGNFASAGTFDYSSYGVVHEQNIEYFEPEQHFRRDGRSYAQRYRSRC